MRILVVSDLHYRLPHYDWLVGPRPTSTPSPSPATSPTSSARCRTTSRPSSSRNYLGLLAERTAVLRRLRQPRPRRPRAHGEQVAGWLRRLDHDGAARRRRVASTSATPGSRSAPGGTARSPARRSARSSPRRPSTGPRAGSGSTTRRRRARRCATTGGVSSPTTTSRTGSRSTEPDVVLCGHIHQAPWAEGGSWHARLGDTWVFNAGKQIGPVPPHITLDTEAGTADWFGVFESETLDLA